MSDTPKTDAAAIRCACSTYVVPSEFARELERENAALRALTKEASLALDGNWHERVDMIKKLDAIDAAREEVKP